MDALDGASAPPLVGVTRRRYTRDELEALRGAPSEEEQTRCWAEVYSCLAAAGFSGEYDGLMAAEKPPLKGKKCGRGGGRKKGNAAAPAPQLEEVSEISTSRNVDTGSCHELPHLNSNDASEEPEVNEALFDQYESVGCEDDSDDDYDSILKPAFVVEGDPDFESGPPLDGFEYLRRVRWEAAQIPRVKVAQIDLSITRNEQTPYMPEIPEMLVCPPELRASKQWKDAFLTYFSETRLAFSQLDSSCDGPSVTGESKDSSKPGSSSAPQIAPTLTMIQSMDAVSRAATLRNYIDMVQSLSTLSRNDCLWLFALCVAVDTPLQADTCASLRSLLRKCTSTLATKSEIDDEVAMLNILVTVSGEYFGQYENR